MPRFLTKLIILTLTILAAGNLLEGIVIADILTAIIAALVFAILNALVKPVLVVLTLPITVLTLGLFLLVLNALILLLTSWLVDGFFVVNFWWGLLGSIFISIVSGIVTWLVDQPHRKRH
jgi:putative membrane protein